MYKVTWSERFGGEGVHTWRYRDQSQIKTHIKEYANLKDIYTDVEKAWSKGYVPRQIECDGHTDVLVIIRNSPKYIGSVYKSLKLHFDIYQNDGGFIQHCIKQKQNEERWAEVGTTLPF